MRHGDWIQTYTGVEFWPLDPHEADINIEDIAHALANQCRFSGHVKQFYSVAEHSVLVASLLPKPLKLWGLLHDASEAYLVDIPRPLKRFTEMGKHYQVVEENLMRCICRRFGLPEQEPPEVKHADGVLLSTEKRDLMGPSPREWANMPDPMQERIIAPRGPVSAEGLFLWCFDAFDKWHREAMAMEAEGNG